MGVGIENGDVARSLHQETREFAVEDRRKSWWYTVSTMLLLIGVLTAAGWVSWWPARLVLSVVGGLLMVRAFVLYHDFMHGAILRNSRLGRGIYYLYGLVFLTPPRSWRHSHNFHHANVGKPIPVKPGEVSLLTSDIGAVPLMTTEMWQRAGFWQKLRYRASRHPLTILFAYGTVFLYSICLHPLWTAPRKFWDGAASLGVHAAIIALLWTFGGFDVAFFAFVLPVAMAAALGAYLFYAQHNYRNMRILPVEQWSHFRAALESSSFLKMGPVMNWFSGNVGYHHVHHLNSKIPFYRLPETMAAIPELQQAATTTLRLSDMIDCFRLCLWDTRSSRMVTCREAARLNRQARDSVANE